MPPELQTIIDRNPWLSEISRYDVVYLSGPMSNLPNLNRDAFHQWEHIIKIQHATVLSPAHADQKKIYSQLIRDGLNMVIHANVTIMLLNWRDSHGANVEWTITTLIGNRVYYEVE
jgi:hypothetical protein